MGHASTTIAECNGATMGRPIVSPAILRCRRGRLAKLNAQFATPESTLPTLPLRRVENSLRMLLNDMHTVVEARCLEHGVGGGTVANAAAGLLPLIAVEIIARRTSAAGESDDDGIRRVMNEIASFTGYRPYGKVGFALFKLFRNGVAHGFLPGAVETANSPKGTATLTFWLDGATARSICVGSIGERLASGHLTLPLPGILRASAQHLYCDVRDFIMSFLDKLSSDPELQAQVDKRQTEIEQDNIDRARATLTDADLTAIGL